MQRIYYTGSDVQELAARGVKRLELGSNVMITDVGRELAEQLGMELIVVGAPSREGLPTTLSPTLTAPVARPRGCQHRPLGSNSGEAEPGTARLARTNRDGTDGLVDSLVDIISGLSDHGG